MPGFAEIVFILIVVLVVIGAGKLPEIATAMGRAIQKVRNQADELDDDDHTDEPGEPPPS